MPPPAVRIFLALIAARVWTVRRNNPAGSSMRAYTRRSVLHVCLDNSPGMDGVMAVRGCLDGGLNGRRGVTVLRADDQKQRERGCAERGNEARVATGMRVSGGHREGGK